MADFGIKNIDNKLWKEIKQYALDNNMTLKELFLVSIKEKIKKGVKK